MNGWHIDDGHVPDPDFLLSSYLTSLWLIVLVCLTKVERNGGPTVLQLRLAPRDGPPLASAPGALNTQRVYSLCAGHRRARRAVAGDGGENGARSATST